MIHAMMLRLVAGAIRSGDPSVLERTADLLADDEFPGNVVALRAWDVDGDEFSKKV